MIMKKQQQERSPRYRFWRNVGIITVSGLIGGRSHRSFDRHVWIRKNS